MRCDTHVNLGFFTHDMDTGLYTALKWEEGTEREEKRE
jgi:hypothetical protein